ncbi:hypothetical protein SAMN04489761_4656 [Tenacibaculum sp. MAR_2009_124]|uniref:hypothetical protein n=1 Tax=Tenacibaculum sp. MAR_2009_124 TaxID=1250059 RepID=UPI0008973F36|nr:hypothetical protein [Tenacibaculum sp. MAR_2009_124]SED21689.1 hypothetical protein SAMN04489761_4656 [Tenacibaculum sp. MAR_2009_124]
MDSLRKHRENEESKEFAETQSITFIPQPFNSMLCGQACLAMIMGKTINEICKDLGKDWSTCIQSDIMPFLNRNGYKTRLIKGVDIDFDEVPNSSIIRIAYPNEKAHFIIKSETKYIDPDYGIIQEVKANRKITHYLTYAKKTQ